MKRTIKAILGYAAEHPLRILALAFCVYISFAWAPFGLFPAMLLALFILDAPWRDNNA